ncbi:MAG: UDP-N-acetylmuramoyl-L-alanine--D-glutamate ligase [Clostridiales bacterium]|nr:UDP-N-acetylmuramoyl-L-alanine--D-glutamate ligase [Clostridiales bacterium]
MLKDKKILIAGAGVSGQGAARLLGTAGYAATIYDGNAALDTEAIRAKLPKDMNLQFVLGEYSDELAEQYDMLVLSPGISIHSPVARSFYQREKPVWGEIELASYFAKGRIAAITGTNGKTTTTALVGSIFRSYYDSVFVVGNIGIPFTSMALETTEESVIAAEISSFQLETTIDFKPAVSAVLNLTPDHLDRHGTMEIYGETKLSISKKQGPDEVIVLNYDDPATRAMAKRTSATPVMFSRQEPLTEGIILSDDTFVIRHKGQEIPVCTTKEIQLLGGHNHENILAAIGICYYMGVPTEYIRKAVMDFEAVEHRIEYVDTVDGVDYYNDSKGTNPDAAIKGIQAMIKPTILLGGGYDKKAEYDDWIASFDGKVKWLILMGATAHAIGATAKAHGFDAIIYVDTFEEAMETAKAKACPGDAVLLSPACASWGMFPNYEVRGQVFKQIVRSFKEGNEPA